MRLSRILMFMGALTLTSLPLAAQGRGGGKPAGVGKPTTTTVKAPKATKPADTSTHGKRVDHAKRTDSTKGGGKSGEHAKNTKTTGDTTETTTASNGRGELTIAERIAKNPGQKASIEAALEGTGLTLAEAADGFKNQGQFIAAVNASKNNPNLSFIDLKAEMTNPMTPLSLGAARQKLLAASNTTTTTTTTSSTSTTTTTTP